MTVVELFYGLVFTVTTTLVKTCSFILTLRVGYIKYQYKYTVYSKATSFRRVILNKSNRKKSGKFIELSIYCDLKHGSVKPSFIYRTIIIINIMYTVLFTSYSIHIPDDNLRMEHFLQ